MAEVRPPTPPQERQVQPQNPKVDRVRQQTHAFTAQFDIMNELGFGTNTPKSRLFEAVFAANLASHNAGQERTPLDRDYKPIIDELQAAKVQYPTPTSGGKIRAMLDHLASGRARRQRDQEMSTVITSARELADVYLNKDERGVVQGYSADATGEAQRTANIRSKIQTIKTGIEGTQQPQSEKRASAKGHEWEARKDVWHLDYPDRGKEYRFGVPQTVIETADGLKLIDDILNTPYNRTLSSEIPGEEGKRGEGVGRNLARGVIPRQFILNLESWRKQPLESLEPAQQDAVARWNRVRGDVEGIFSLENVSSDENYALRDCYQIFFGRNNPLHRRTSSQQMAAEMTHAREVFDQAAGTEPQPFDMEELKRKGYRIEQLTAQSDWVDQYRKLIEDTFGVGTDMPGEVQDRTSIVLVVIDKQGNVVSGVTAYKDEDEISRVVERGGRKKTIKTPVRVFEIENAVTASGHEGQGLYTALSADVMNKLAQVKPPIHLVYRSTNANSENGLSASAHIDRTLAEGLGLPVKPFEQQNIDAGRFVDGIISYVSGNELRSRQWVKANAA